jgi:hypothetical protein
MATINLGSIKFNWKGTYAGGTAYVVDDVVEYNGSSYICILASTGNLPTNATYFEQMSSAGTNGTDGTDLTTTLTTQGDLVYRDGSGLQRLGAGTAGQVLQSGGTGANPSWTNVSSDFVKLIDQDITSTVSGLSVTGWIDNTTYQGYLIRMSRIKMTAEDKFKFHWVNDSGTNINTGTNYLWQTDHDYLSGGTGNTNIHSSGGDNGIQFTSNNYGTSYHKNIEISVTALDLNTAGHTQLMFQCLSRESGGQIDYGDGFGYLATNDTFSNSSAGFALDRQGSGSLSSGNISVYGLK